MIIDLRSDTLTSPTIEMREAMANAVVGDDVFEEDPTVAELEQFGAELTGKEAALFVPTGHMGNLVSLMTHCNERGSEFLVGHKSHMYVFEGGSAASIAGVHPRVVQNKPDGTMDLDELKSLLRVDNVHFPRSKMLTIEQTHNMCGGRVLPLEFMDKIGAFCKEHKLKLHIDGARIFNAATALGVEIKRLTEHADSISFCLSKGLGAPVGSLVVGSKDFIHECRRHRKALGGGMRQVGVLAAAGLVAIQDIAQILSLDHDNAKRLAHGLNKIPRIHVDVDTVETNIVMATVDKSVGPCSEFVERLKVNGLKVIQFSDQVFRLCTYHELNSDDMDRAVKIVGETMAEF